ncbi:(-)-germacrene D synthase [Thalictrum thalictroides]|uniref:(-)-germacrene D synthase n=1 Tax=Thalictrum thalictroides TaxID=46969 RepID=A0A7J6VH59_THATH|nr:(-)-germacrene D synthase [Thalictrum thalictroides]
MAAMSSTFMPMLSVFGKPTASSKPAVNPRSVGKLLSSRSAINYSSLKNVATKCSNVSSSDATPPEVKRHFHPSVWDGFDFTSASKSHLIDERRLKELKKEVKNMLSLAAAAADSFQELYLVDKIQRLGVAYHFKDEIECILQRIYNDDYTHFLIDQNIRKDEHVDLYYVSLRFRLLRQAGYYVSTGGMLIARLNYQIR